MKKLQELLEESLANGQSFRSMSEKCGINHVSLSQYHKGLDPDPKNLAVLSKFFRVDLAELADSEENERVSDPRRQHSTEIKLIVDELDGMDSTELLELLLKIRKERGARNVIPQTSD